MDPINEAMKIGASGMHTQSVRLRIISENVANAQSIGNAPGADPYRRKTVTFINEVDKAGTPVVKIKEVGRDMSSFPIEFSPNNPAANAEGYVKMPNVNTLIEMTDMREATRSFEANVTTIEQSKAMLNRTIDLLRN